MTNEEAIKWLRLDIDLTKFDPLTGEDAYLNDDARHVIEAQEMAIAALEQLEPCEDAVSREALRKAMYHRAFETDGDTMWQSGCWIRYRAVEQVIKESPSVTPKRKCGKWNAYYHGINETPSFTYSCNQCGYSAPYGLYGGKYSQKKWNFCPNCGAKMI